MVSDRRARALRHAVTLAAPLIAWSGCGGGPAPGSDAGPPSPDPVSVQNVAAYEGQQAFVTVLESAGDDWSTATVTATSGGIEVISYACGASLCGVVARVPDLARNSGQSIPAPIDAMRHFLRVDAPAGASQGLIQVFPLDELTASGTTTTSGNYFASSVSAGAGSTIRGMGTEPIRWFVFGDARIETFDVSAMGGVAGSGGGAGGAAGAAGAGEGGGAAATASAGAGGGASAEDGSPGAMSTTVAAAIDPACVVDAFATSCGGGGGGGATGPGGAGAGGLQLVVLGSLTLTGITANGGDAETGSAGGGGGGGLVHVAATSLDSTPTIQLEGGAGDGTGGAGGRGGARIDADTGSSLIRGPRIDVDPAGLLVRSASFVITGDALAGATVRVERVVDSTAREIGTGEADGAGAFSLTITLEPGLNRLRVIQVDAMGEETRAFNGNHLELERRDGFVRQLPIGGLLDVAYVP